MKKTVLILIIFSFILGVSPVLSVPAAPVNHTLVQSDSSSFIAKLVGSENSHVWITTDGYSIIFDETMKDWTYAISGTDGILISSKKVVGKDSPGNIKKNLRPTGKGLLKISKLNSGQASGLSDKVVSPVGTANIPVILINFKDTTTAYTAANFNSLLFGAGVKSMKDYFEEVSYGNFSVSAGPGGVAGWYKASQIHNYYGTNDAWGYDKWPGTLVREAVAAADTTYNFAPYDLDGDCYVDIVDLVHQGTGEEAGGPATDIWSHSWDLNSAYYWGNSDGGEYTTNDACSAGGNVKINSYVIQPEILWGGQQTMGVFAHEYGHALGLPDLYDTDYTSEGIGIWSLMAGGSWNGISREGDSPAHMDAWSKYFLGWILPIKISQDNLTQIKQVETNREVYQLRDNPGGAQDWTGSGTGIGEYFLVENRRKTGFDAALPGQGLLIWHVDETRPDNTDDTHRLVDLEEADGNDIPTQITDPWVSNIIGFTNSTTSNSRLYNGSDSHVRVTDISASASTMTANLIVGVSSSMITFVSPTPANNSILSRTWVYVNITASEPLTSALLEWNGTNESMTGGGMNWYLNKTSLAIGNYSYKVRGHAGSGKWITSETRNVKLRNASKSSVLIINDDNDVYSSDDQSVDAFKSDFEGIGYDITIENSSETLNSTWGLYNIVVWSSGDDVSPIYDPNYKGMLVDYVGKGGHLILESGHIAAWIDQFGGSVIDMELRNKVLHATSDWVYSDVGNLNQKVPCLIPVLCNNLPQTINFTPDNPGDDSGDADAVRILPDAIGVYNYSYVNYGGSPIPESVARISYAMVGYDDDSDVSNGGQIVFMAFDIDDIDDPDMQRQLIQNSENWLNPMVSDLNPPIVTNPAANQSDIPDDTDNMPLWGETAQLNVTVTDASSIVSVTVNLSDIGGPAAKPMTNIGGNIYSTTTNASAGTLPKLYNLTVTAIDTFGNSNTSVRIELRVRKNGDTNGNNAVNIGDALRLANNVSYPGNPAYALSSIYVADVSGNGVVNIGDALRLANNVSYPGNMAYILK